MTIATTEPTATEMESFASQFTKDQWAVLCCNPAFRKAILEDLDEAGEIAIKRYPDKKGAK